MTVDHVVRLDELPARHRLRRGERGGAPGGAGRAAHPDDGDRRGTLDERWLVEIEAIAAA